MVDEKENLRNFFFLTLSSVFFLGVLSPNTISNKLIECQKRTLGENKQESAFLIKTWYLEIIIKKVFIRKREIFIRIKITRRKVQSILDESWLKISLILGGFPLVH